MKKVLAMLLAALMLCCTAAAAGAEDQVTLRFMWWGGDARHEATIQVIEKYMEAHPNVVIEPEFGGSDGYFEKLSTQLYSGTAADIIQCGTGWMPDFMQKGDFFVNFDEYRDKIDLTNFDEGYLQNTGVFEGKLVGLPTGVASNTILVNTKLADELGLDYQTQLTWDRMLELGRQVQEKDADKYLFNTDAKQIAYQIVRPYIMQLTGRPFIDNETGARSFDKDQLVEVLDFVRTCYDSKVFQPAEESAPFKDALNTNPKLIAGDFVMAHCVSSTITPLVSAYPDGVYDVIQVPLKEGRLNDGFYPNPPQLLVVSKNTKNVDVCMDFLNYFYNDPEAAVILRDHRSVPAVSTARQICVENNLIDPIVSKSVDISMGLNGVNEMGLTTNSEVEAAILDMVENVAYGTRSTEEIADETIQLLDDILANL